MCSGFVGNNMFDWGPAGSDDLPSRPSQVPPDRLSPRIETSRLVNQFRRVLADPEFSIGRGRAGSVPVPVSNIPPPLPTPDQKIIETQFEKDGEIYIAYYVLDPKAASQDPLNKDVLKELLETIQKQAKAENKLLTDDLLIEFKQDEGCIVHTASDTQPTQQIICKLPNIANFTHCQNIGPEKRAEILSPAPALLWIRPVAAVTNLSKEQKKTIEIYLAQFKKQYNNKKGDPNELHRKLMEAAQNNQNKTISEFNSAIGNAYNNYISTIEH